MTMTEKDSCCCPKFEPEAHDEKEVIWKDKPFAVDSTFCFLYIPLNFSGLMSRVDRKLAANNAKPEDKDAMVLQRVDPCSPWIAHVLVASTKNTVEGLEMTTLSGTFLTKVYEGPYKDVGTWVKLMQDYVKEKGKKAKCMYARYATCPKCAEKYGKNYVVMMAQAA